MATYVVGDVQGCSAELQDLLALVGFSAATDQLWLTGDLVNRGAQSLETLRFVRSLGRNAVSVLGNHDIHLLAVYYAEQPKNESDTFDALLSAPDCAELLDWLRRRPLLHRTGTDLLVHAGIPHMWSVTQAEGFAREVECALQGEHFRNLLRVVYGDCPRLWQGPGTPSGGPTGVPRLRAIINYLTRMRIINQAGRCDFDFKGPAATRPSGFKPWFDFRPPSETRILFGHWAALRACTGRRDIEALDGGCAWGAELIALRLEDGRRFSVPSRLRQRNTAA